MYGVFLCIYFALSFATTTATLPKPSRFTVDIINLTAVVARWDQVPKKQLQSVFLGYNIKLYNQFSHSLIQTFITHETRIVVKDCQARLWYDLYVQGYTRNETGPSAYYMFYIPPILRPSGMKITITNETAAYASWNPIPKEHVLGNLLGYKLQLYKYGSASQYFKTDATSIVINSLDPGSVYKLYVSGITSNETGDASYYEFLSRCGGILNNQLQGKITVNGHNAKYDINCKWKTQAKHSSSVILIFIKSLDIPALYNCRKDYLKLSDGQGRLLSRLCRPRNSMTFLSFGSASIEFHLSLWWRPYHVSFSYSIFSKPIKNLPSNYKRSWNISAASNSSSSIAVQWTEYPGQESVNNYIAVCIAQNNHGLISTAQTDGQNYNVVVSNLLKNMKYVVFVLALNRTQLNSTIWKSQSYLTRTIEDVPSKPPNDVRAASFGTSSIVVTWKSLNDTNGVIVGYNVYYQETRGSGSSVIFVNSYTTKKYLKKLKHITEYTITVAALTRVGEGPRSRNVYVTTDPGFHQKLSGSSGRFTSPNYPSSYPSNANCTWTIAKDNVFDKLFIMFSTFDIEESVNGRCSDFVKVLDKNGSMLSNGCGRKRSFAVITARYAVVTLQSDNGIEKSGFNATFFTTDIKHKEKNTGPKNTIYFDPSKTITAPYSKVMTLKVNWITSTEVSMYCSNPLSSIQSACVFFYKEYTNSGNWNFFSARIANVTISGLLPSTQYAAMVTESSNNMTIYQSDHVTFVTSSLPTTRPTDANATASVKLMYDYGQNEGDLTIPNTWMYAYGRCMNLSLNEDGFLFLTKRHHEIYICRNGVLRFESPYYVHWPVNFGSTCNLQMLAPYWSLSDRHHSTVFYHVYQESDTSSKTKKVLDQATVDVSKLYKGALPSSFKATWVLVVTWHELRHSTQNSQTKNLRNTFQAVLITDGIVSFAMYNYPMDGIEWSAPSSKSNWNHFTGARGLPVVGWSAGCGKTEFYNIERSGTVNIGDIDQTQGHTVSITRRGIVKSQHGSVNKWLFQLYKPWKRSSAFIQCKAWFKKQPDPRPFLEYLDPCPCTSRQAWFDERFTPEKHSSRYSWWTDPSPCAISTFPSIDGWEQKCCYTHEYPQWGALVVGHPGGGFAHRYSKISSSGDHFVSDLRGYIYCCTYSNLCHLFYKRRPSDNCGRYKPPQWSWMWGDPHFATLDGTNYTFNGLGEYTMLDARNGFFQLQSRTRLAKGDGTATVFCAAVMKEGNRTSVQLNLERNGNITLLVDGTKLDFYSLTNETKRLNGCVVVTRPKENEFRATYPSGISVTLTASKGALSVLVALPRSLRNQTKGLLGTWNGNKLDDLTTPNGYVVPANASSRSIHFDFGQKWQVNEKNTLFTYNNYENVSTFSNTSFIPMFVDERKFANKTLEKQALEECGDDINCLFDAASTNDISVGLDTKVVGSQMVNDSIILKNSPPKFPNSTDAYVVLLMVNTTKHLNITAEDTDGDSIRFDVSGLPKGAVMWTNGSTVSVFWDVTMEKIDLQFTATDSKGAAAVLRPFFKLCACQNGGRYIDVTSSLQNQESDWFVILPCQCSSGYTGNHFEVDIDACKVNLNPCYPGVVCNDFPAPANETGYECGTCPSGFTGKGDSCKDIDECSGSNGCSQTCSNTPGSYVCGCRKGFSLNIDGRTCEDVNECNPTSDCMHNCENKVGSYRCSCNKYFKVDPTNSKKCKPKLPCRNGNHKCKDICYESNGVATCACKMGYELQPDQKTCLDVDECKIQKNRCNQLCQNTQGGYDCSCINGFRLSDDNVTCVDINECIEWIFNCSTSQRCENTMGSYECKCDHGLYWIDNRCQELPTGEKVPTQPPPPRPPTPSEQDIYNSVNVTIRQFNISEWDLQMDLTFKKVVAREVTTFCVKGNTCQIPQRRERRSNSYVTFTSDQVYLLPEFPVQVYNSIPGDYNAVVAFYVKFPSDSNTIDGDMLAKIINGSLGRIGKDIGKLVLSVSIYQHKKESTTESPHTTSSTMAPDDSNMMYIIIGSSLAGGVLIAIVVIAIVAVRYCKTQKKKKEMVQNATLVAMYQYGEPVFYSNPTTGHELE